MKKTTKIFGLLLTLFGLALVTGCTPITDTPEVPEETTYTVTYVTAHGTAPASIPVTENTVLTAEQLPELSEDGWTFTGWFDGNTKVEAGYKVTKDITLTAKWNENTPEPAPEDDSNNDDENQEGSEETSPTETDSENPPVIDEPENDEPEETPPVDEPTDPESTTEETPSEGTEEPSEEEPAEETPTDESDQVDESEATPEETITYTISFSNANNVEGIVKLPTLRSYSAGETDEIDVSEALNLNLDVAYIVWTDGTNEYNTDGSNKIIIENISSNIILTAKELWFKNTIQVKLYCDDELLFTTSLSECNIATPISKKDLKDSFKLYKIEGSLGDDYFTNPSNPDGSLLLLTNVEYTDGIVKLYFTEAI